ncbi:gliding motility-associated-like protein [Chryseobacterium ginsenosidimutans]|uniref:T9SS type B sorting domain-containing protein n=1 Tax=Chryseobacterium ginsenosidimutans TaxID=687846 RepID=UPI0021694264|nr:gliding motility-associated C-terminal domain-containing protein [Chryseobacterium ginsenosidimutans]MCS3869480.1 gliding motility-associated-like protein [Chryseobacterium ginsenosidimutans]
MIKRLLLFLLFLTVNSVFAQKNKEHWFAPMMSRNSLSSSNNRQALYFSTDSTTPFPVTIYNNNAVIGTITISNGNPGVFVVPVDLIIAYQQSEVFKVTSRGLHAKADVPFMADLRVSDVGHGEIITSKGKSGIGKKFYAAYAPITNISSGTTTTHNFTCGILATEDNTSVTVSGYDPSVQFSNGMTGATNPTITFFLNKGQSYIIEGRSNVAANRAGFIGAKITADKPISLNNGNFVGQYSLPNNTIFDGPDITLDQSVPVERLGKEYVLVKGMGNITKETEGAIIVATEDNTQIFINNNTVSVVTLNEGQFYRVTAANYINQGNDHFNMYIRTSKNAYVYHLVAGVAGSNATGSFNFVPPIGCIQSKKIDEIPKVDDLPRVSNTVPLPLLSTKLNVLTQAGANLTVNGIIPTVIEGPYSVSGNPYWVTYSLMGLSGNVKIDSDKPVSAEIIGGSIFLGYSGYYAEDASCQYESTKAIDVCYNTQIIVPDFTYSTQSYLPNSVVITSPPQYGTATIDPVTGVINYMANSGYVGIDTIVYRFCGNDPIFTDCEQVTLTLNMIESPIVSDAVLRTCFLENNIVTGLFNLTTAPVSSQVGTTKKYYPSPTDAINGTNEILNPTNYIAPSGVAYVKVTNAYGCYKVAQVTLIVFPPVTSPVLIDKVICMEDKTTLDAGPTFDGYQWSTGVTAQTISDVTVGTYWVRLKTGECWTKQTVKVYSSEQPVITSIEINANTVTVYATGGTVPYKYSIDNINWQDSNVFTKVPRGNGIVYVRDAYDCTSVSVEITIPNLINAITPNNDGINDILDYSALAHKENFKFSVYDRYGLKVFDASKNNGYKWDGSYNGRKLSTGTCWYSISWTESKLKRTEVKYSGWVLVKNK